MNKEMADLQFFILDLADMTISVKTEYPDDKKLLDHIYRLMKISRRKLEDMKLQQRKERRYML